MHTQQPPAIHTQQPPATPAQHTAARHPQQPLPSHAQQPPATDTQQPAATDAQQPPATDAQQVPATPSQQTPGMRSQGPGLQTPESTGKQSQLGSPSPRLRRDLLATGVTDAEIRAAVRRGRTTRLGSGLYVDTHLYRTLNPDEQYSIRVRAEVAKALQLVVSHESAATIHELPLVRFDRAIVHLTRPGTGGGRRTATRWVHAGELPGKFRIILEGVDLTSVARTLVDLGRTSAIDTTVAAGDAALHGHITSWSEILDALREARCHKGSARAWRALRLLDARAESPGESLLRLGLMGRGLPEPTLQVEIRDDRDRFVARVDLAFLRYGVLVEFDGRGKYRELLKPGQDVTQAVLEEKAREELLTELGWLVIRVTWADLRDPGRLAERIARACRSRRRLVEMGAIRGNAIAPPWNRLPEPA